MAISERTGDDVFGLLKNIRILTKISIPAVVIAAVATGIVAYSTHSLSALARTTESVVTKEGKRVELALEAEALFNSAAVSEKNVILFQEEEPKRTNIANYDKISAAVLQTLDRLAPITEAADQRALIEVFRTAVGDRRKASARVFELALQHKDAEAFAVSVGEGAKFRKIAIDAVDKLIALNRGSLDAARLGAAALADQTRMVLVGSAVIGLVVAFLLLGWIALFQIARPLFGMTAEMERLAKGDLDIAIVGAERRDEVGALARSLEVFKQNAIATRRLEAEKQAEQEMKARRQIAIEGYIATFEGGVRGSLNALASAATEMRATSQGMAATAEEASRQATTVAAAAEEASVNVQTVAAATEELSSSVTEIGRQVTQSTKIAGEAVEEASRTNATVNGLSEAAQKIGDVVKLISDIASQTNLLALNATIEAARAGEAGKGFAVVASEVKSLANQTASATEEITAQVTAMQSATSRAVQAIGSIGGTIGTINEIATTIAAAVEEQGAATQEIARNVQGAAEGTHQVSANIVGVNQAAAETGVASEHVLTAAEELGRQAETLRSDVDSFLAQIRAA
jgi:methyl-accepting chemotaxis protein